MKIVLPVLLIVHGLIHLLGFVKAFNFAKVSQLTQPVTKTNGLLWLIAALLFATTALIFVLKNNYWWIVSITAIFLSQYLVFTSWRDAKFGTAANTIILAITIIVLEGWGFSNQ